MKVRNHSVLMRCGGRPRKLDDASMDVLKAYLTANPNQTVPQIKRFMLGLQRAVVCRYRRIQEEDITEEIEPRPLSHRTVLRYVRAVQPGYAIGGNSL